MYIISICLSQMSGKFRETTATCMPSVMDDIASPTMSCIFVMVTLAVQSQELSCSGVLALCKKYDVLIFVSN